MRGLRFYEHRMAVQCDTTSPDAKHSMNPVPIMPRPIASAAELTALLHHAPAVLLHFTTPQCAVCQTLKPRIAALLAEQFPRMVFAEVECTAAPALAAQYQVFTVPTLLLFLEGRESLRWVRNLHLSELREQLARPYALLYGDEA